MHRAVFVLALSALGTASARAQSGCGEPFTPIFAIQGPGPSSPLRGARVQTEGVVSAARTAPEALGGFFLQDPVGDADARTSDGVFVYVPGADVREGDALRVEGSVVEFFGQTELAAIGSIRVCGSGAVHARPLALPQDELEAAEGMLVHVAHPLHVTDTFNLHRFGEVALAAGGPLAIPTDTPASRASPVEAELENRRRTLLLDDGSRAAGPLPVPYLAGNTLRRGDRVLDLTGVIGFAFGAFRVHPVGGVEIDPASARPAPPRACGALRIVSLNLHNYWTTLDDGENGARGADSAAELARQRAKLVASVRALRPDVLALQELENNGYVAIGDLLRTLDPGRPRPTWCALPDPEYPGGLGSTDRIKVGVLYRCGRVRPLGAPLADLDPVHASGRPPLAQRFRARRFEFSLVVAHLKSKDCSGARGAEADQGDGQGCFNARRTRQAEALLRFLELGWRPAGEGVLLLGDFNAYTEEDPVRALRTRLRHLLRDGPGPPASHSYVFGGAHGLLDHAFATPGLVRLTARATVWHINSDEPRLLGYDDEVLDPGELAHERNPPGAWAPDAFRSSDHDPVVIDLGELTRRGVPSGTDG